MNLTLREGLESCLAAGADLSLGPIGIETGMTEVLRIGELAGLTGVSVRTLHHYDQIGLLRPTRYSEGGHRLYAEMDLLRLQQIMTLRFLGFPLIQIVELLDRPDFDLVASLRAQRLALRERIAELRRIDVVLSELLETRDASDCWHWELVLAAVAAARDGLEKEGATMEKVKSYYTSEQLSEFDELGARIGSNEIRQIEEGWTALLADVRANLDLDAADPRAAALADRWDILHERTMSHYRANPELMQAIQNNYDAGNFDEFERAPQAADLAFIERVKAARAAPD